MAATQARPIMGLKWLAVLAGAALLVAALELFGGAWRPFASAPPAGPPTTLNIAVGFDSSYREAIDGADRAILGARARAEGDESWLAYDLLAQALVRRARLTGSFDDYAAADQALGKAEALASEGTGPDLRRAAFDFTMHRLGSAAASLDKVDRYAIRSDVERSESEGMRGDIALYRGDYDGALRRYDAADAISPHASDYRRAVLEAGLGNIDQAIGLIGDVVRATKLPTGAAVANYELTVGAFELRRGEWDSAAAHFARADKVFPGYWLAEANVAQSLALAGKTDEAIRRFEAIARINDAPEVMDALAALYRARGDAARSNSWAAKASAVWEKRLQQFPDAAYGHAAEHELAFGEPARALELAQRDFASRPHGATATTLGWAWIANNRPAEALRAVAPVLASKWRSADTYAVAAQAYTLLGEGDKAEQAREQALAINPRALDPAGALIWFGH